MLFPVGGDVQITHYKMANLFNDSNAIVKFFLLPTLKTFDAILGNDSLKELGTIIDSNRKLMYLKNSTIVNITEKKFEAVNTIIPKIEHLRNCQKLKLSEI